MKRKLVTLIALLFVSLVLISCDNEESSFKVTFNLNGGTPTIEPVEVNYNEKIEEPKNPSKSGYIFAGWYLGDEKFDFNQNITSDITLIAKWTESKDLTITFLYGYDNLKEVVIISENEKLPKPNNPNRDGYVFVGWYIDDIVFDFDSIITKELTLIAKWENKTIKDIVINEGKPLVFDLDDFRLEDIYFEITYNDETKEEIKATREMLSDYDFETLFLTGSFYIHFLINGIKQRAQITLNSNNNEISLPNVVIYAIKETVDNKDIYTFYSLGKGSFVSMEMEFLVNDSKQLIIENYQEGLFSKKETENKLNIIYSFGENITGNNKLFKITGDVGFNLSYVLENSNIYKFVDEDVIKEEDIRFYFR